eukprot:3445393-Prymnesium_polylepis.1
MGARRVFRRAGVVASSGTSAAASEPRNRSTPRASRSSAMIFASCENAWGPPGLPRSPEHNVSHRSPVYHFCARTRLSSLVALSVEGVLPVAQLVRDLLAGVVRRVVQAAILPACLRQPERTEVKRVSSSWRSM